MRLRSFWQRIDIFAILAFILPLFVYLLTLAPSVTFFDSGEFITAISCLGSPHSPGYPLFVNFGKPFTWLPFGSIAFRVNFATAISGAMACYAAYLLTEFLLKEEKPTGSEQFNSLLRRGAGLAAALTFACSARLWLQSNHDKPYPLVAFLAAIVFYLVLRWRDSYREGEERPSFIFIGAFLCGLGTAAHQTIILMIPAYAFLILVEDWRIIFRVRDFLLSFLFGLLGFAINLHLPIRATRFPLLNWGNPQTKDQFLWHFLRRGYPMEKPDRGLSLLWDQVNAFNVPYEFTMAGAIIMIIGMAAFLGKRRNEVIAYALALLSFLLVIAGYFNTPKETIFLTEEFFTPLYLLSAVFIGLGLYFLARTIFVRVTSVRLGGVPIRLLATLLLMILPATVCALHYVENDQHLNYIAYDYASNTLRSAKQGAVIYTWGDSGAFPLWYLQGIERMREDLDVLHTPHLVFDWYLDSFPKLFKNSLLRRIPLDAQSPENVLLLAVAEQYPNRQVMIDYSTRYSVPFNDYRFLQRGIAYELVANATPVQPLPNMAVWDLYYSRGLYGKEMFFRDLDTGKAIMIYANCRMESGEDLLRSGNLGEGVTSLRQAAQISPELGDLVNQTLARFRTR